MNALVIDAMRKSVSGVTGRFASISCTPAPFTCTSFPSFTTPQIMPGMCASTRYCSITRSISARVAALCA